ncbi:tRNA uridine-5-carboxymethylaminomethyl(34) synthesis GTPase MnmE [Arhodomonas sp. SL1]|uniref:tRNA uridine-5-carboxymethylaminomethyl(34) synthesis GTPase MnmE n=1 Tax=Arhodomonas sp. SL1 TaxID=3425691 RepID=UPI003F88110E
MATDTICAIATPPGHGGVGIVRVSGPAVPVIAEGVLGTVPRPRFARFAAFRGEAGEVLDEGIALYFPGPRSFTGEDVLELQGHGGPVVMGRLLARVVALGARHAEPGEFSQRAFLNDRLDLAQAEAVADLINARTEAGARAAMRSLTGEFSQRVEALVEGVTRLRIHVESAIDFADEDIDFLADPAVAHRLAGLQEDLEQTLAAARRGRALGEGMTVVIIGRPNTGKSSLLNRLAGGETAIVTEIPGTTRDVLREQIRIDGLPMEVLDTAGLRDTDNPVELEGVRRAWQAIERADRVLLVVDDTAGPGPAECELAARLPAGTALSVIRNKIDLTGVAPGTGPGSLGDEVRLSAHTGAGMEALASHLKAVMGYSPGDSTFTARRRHIEALETAGGHLQVAAGVLAGEAAGEVVAEELRLAQEALGEITGRVTSEELLGRIFATFCIGK